MWGCVLCRRVLKRAFDTWSEPSQLTVNYDPTNPDIRVSFWSREHGDGDGNAFDGEGRNHDPV